MYVYMHVCIKLFLKEIDQIFQSRLRLHLKFVQDIAEVCVR